MKPEDRKRLFDVIAPQLSWEDFKRGSARLVWLRSEIAKAISRLTVVIDAGWRNHWGRPSDSVACWLGSQESDLVFLRKMQESTDEIATLNLKG